MALSEVKREVIAKVRGHVGRLIEGRTVIVMPDVASSVTKELGSDPAFVRKAGEAFLRDLVYDQVQRMIALTRANDYVAAGNNFVPREEFEAFAQRTTGRLFDRWIEHVGGRSVQFLAMTRPDIDAAIEERRAVVKHHGDIVALLAQVRAKLANDTMQVKEVFTAAQLDAMYSCIQDKSTQQPYI